MKELTWSDLHNMSSLKGIVDFLEPRKAFSLMIAMDLIDNDSFDKNLFLISILIGIDNIYKLSQLDGIRTTEFAEFVYDNYASKLRDDELNLASIMYAKSINGIDIDDIMKNIKKEGMRNGNSF